MILGLAAAFHFEDNYLGDAGKSKGFSEYLSSIIATKDIKSWKNKTAGVIQDLLLLEKILEHYANAVEMGNLNAPTIGIKEKSESLFNQWLADPNKNKNGEKESD